MTWINKTVGFKEESTEEMELLKFARSLPNFTELVKDWLRHLKRLKEEGKDYIPIMGYSSKSRDIVGNNHINSCEVKGNNAKSHEIVQQEIPDEVIDSNDDFMM